MDMTSHCTISMEQAEPEDIKSELENLPYNEFIVIGSKHGSRHLYLKYDSSNPLYFDLNDKVARTPEDMIRKYEPDLVVVKVLGIECVASHVVEYTDKQVYAINKSIVYLTMNKPKTHLIPVTDLTSGDWFELKDGEIGIMLSSISYYSFSKGCSACFQPLLNDTCYPEFMVKLLNVDLTVKISDKEEEE